MRWLAAFALLFGAVLARAEPSAPPLDAYGKLQTYEVMQLSPDAKRLATIVTNGDLRAVTVIDLATKAKIVSLPAGDRKVVALDWAGPDHVLIEVEHDSDALGYLTRKAAMTLGFDLNLEKRQLTPLLRSTGSGFNIILGPLMVRQVDGKPSVFFGGLQAFGRGAVTLARYDPATGTSGFEKSGPPFGGQWVVGADGRPLAVETYNANEFRWALLTRSSDGPMSLSVSEIADIEVPHLAGLGRDGTATLVHLPADGRNRTTEALVEVPSGLKIWPKPLVEGDIRRLIRDPVSETLIGYAQLIGDEQRYTFFDPADQRIWSGIEKAYPGAFLTLWSLSADHKRWLVEVDSPTEGPAYALVDLASGKASWIAANYEAASKELAVKTPVVFKASDGLDLTGYLTVPKGREAKKLPLVVFPHGGPQARDEPGFDWWAQAMASRGYAVLQVNFRGSGGMGWSFLNAGFGQWGRKMQTDLSDGVKFLADKGVIDPQRVCIVGASYGGYAALAGATLQPGTYRCAVAVAGISDPRKLVGSADERSHSPAKRYLWRYMGADGDRKEVMDAISPIRHASEVTAPILLIHGKDDTVVDYSQSQLMYDALKKAGKDVRLVTLNHEDHWLLTGATRLQMLQATMDFLLKNDPPA